MNLFLQNKSANKTCKIEYRKEQRNWVFGSDKDVDVTFEVSFDNEMDRALVRIFLLELNDSKRNIMNA
jgi:hypothetical protein